MEYHRCGFKTKPISQKQSGNANFKNVPREFTDGGIIFIDMRLKSIKQYIQSRERNMVLMNSMSEHYFKPFFLLVI